MKIEIDPDIPVIEILKFAAKFGCRLVYVGADALRFEKSK